MNILALILNFSIVALNLDDEFYFSSLHASLILLVKHDYPNVFSAMHSILELLGGASFPK